jgi:hypothetical protein
LVTSGVLSEGRSTIAALMTSITYPARQASTTELEHLSDLARELGLGSAGNPRLWAESNRAVLHVGYAVSKDLIAQEPDANTTESTVWTLASGYDVLLTVWWVRLKKTPVTSAPVFPILITLQPEEYAKLTRCQIGGDQVAEAQRLADDFLKAAGL